MNLDEIKKDIRLKHAQKVFMNATSAVAIFKGITGAGKIITPTDKSKLKNLLKFCNEHDILFKDLITKYNDNFGKVVSMFKDDIKYLREDLSEPSVAVLYDSRVLKYVCSILLEGERKLVKTEDFYGHIVEIYSDGTRKVIFNKE